jgi:hypothetical protein
MKIYRAIFEAAGHKQHRHTKEKHPQNHVFKGHLFHITTSKDEGAEQRLL